MVVTINGSSSAKEIELALQNFEKGLKANKNEKKHFDAFKYCGVIKLEEDPIAIQKRMRNEWE